METDAEPVGPNPMLLHARDLQVSVGTTPVLSGVSVTLQAGQWVAIVGPNGAGKSTLLATLAGLRQPQQGQIWLQGRELQHWNTLERAQRLAWLAQHWEGEGELSCEEVVSLGRLPHRGLRGPWSAPDRERAQALMQALGIDHLAHRSVGSLSGGERQRVLLARVFCVGAALVLLDEPTTHLDPPHSRLWLQLAREQLKQGVGLVTVLHDLNTALQADRVVVMAQGAVVADAAPGSVELFDALERVFAQAVEIREVRSDQGSRWVAWTR